MGTTAMQKDGEKVGSAEDIHAMEDTELVRRAVDDPEAFGQLFEKYYSVILNFLYRRTLDMTLAEELTGGTFFKALKNLPACREQGHFRPWLYRIATNEARMHWRSERTRREHQSRWARDLGRVTFDSHGVETKEQVQEKMQVFARLRGGLDRLPEKYRTVLELRYFEGLSYVEIAEVLEKKNGTVKSLIHRGLKRLKRNLETDNATFSADLHPTE